MNCGAACGQFQFPVHAQRAAGALPGKGPIRDAAIQRNPQHFHRARTGSVSLRTSHPHACAQPAGKRTSCRAGQAAGRRARACLTRPARRTARLRARAGGDRARRRTADARRRLESGRFPRVLPAVTARPPGDLARAFGRDPGHHGWPSGGCGVPVQARASRPGRIRQGPSMYEMEGPCPASPHRLVSCLALPTPRAARRGQVPARGAGLPAPPTFPGPPGGRPQVMPVSDGETFLLHKRAPRKSPRPAISGFPAIREMIHRERAVIRTSRQLSTGLFTVILSLRI
jgi:hypothetical protein